MAMLSFFLLPILIGLGARWSARAEIQSLTASNIALSIENNSYRDATGQLSSQISALQDAVDDLGIRAEVDPDASRAMDKLPSAVRSRAMGGGGAAAAVAPMLSSALSTPDAAFGVLRDILGVIESRLDSVRTGVEQRQALASATPSIWPVTGWLSSAFGNRRDPFTGEQRLSSRSGHLGDYGQPVLATADGTCQPRARPAVTATWSRSTTASGS